MEGGQEFESLTISSRSSSSTQAEALTEFSTFIGKLNPIISEMKDYADTTGSPALQNAIGSLEADYNRAKAAVDSQTIRSSPAKHIESLVQELGRSLGLVLFSSHEAPMSNKEKIEALCKEMMNVRFDFSSDHEFEFAIEETEGEIEDVIVEEEQRVLTVDDAILQIRRGGDEEGLKNTLLLLYGFIVDGMVSHERVVDQDVVKVLTSRLSSCKGQERVIVIRILRYLTLQNDQHKEKMKDCKFLSALVKSLTRGVEERKEAVGLLLSLCNDGDVRRRVGRIQGCIVILVSIANEDDQEASHDATMLLNSMSGNTQHVLHMAEACYFKPLIKYLKEGSEMSKVLMATALSRLELTDQNKASLGEEGAIEPLVNMFNVGNLEAKLSALNALQSLSNSKQNIKRLVDTGIVVSLLQLLFSVTSILMMLREPASSILAKVARSESILVKRDIAQQMLSLLSLSSPVVQNHLLEALNSIVLHSCASKIRERMKENGAIRLLLPFFTERDSRIRTGALKLVYVLTKDIQGELTEQLDYANVNIIANIFSTSTSECEKAAALGLLSNLPMSDKKLTDILKKANIVPLMVSHIMSLSSTHNSTPTIEWLAESIAGLLLRFTVASDKNLQHYSAENGVIPMLVKLLSSSSQMAKSKAALCLSQLSQNTLHLSKSRKLKWFCVPPTMDALCEVHNGCCSIKSTFCLVKSGAINPFVRILEGEERGADEAVLSCLSTFLQDEIWESGCSFLMKMSGVEAIIKVLTRGSFKAQEKALWILERVFRVEDCRNEYSECAKVVLIDLAQNGDAMLAPAVAKVLAQLELLQEQSCYF